jgi:hypothetical protein
MSNNDPIPFPKKNTNINPQKVKPSNNSENLYIEICNIIPEFKPGEVKPEDLQVNGPIYIVKMLHNILQTQKLYKILNGKKVKILSKIFSPEKRIDDKHVSCPFYELNLEIIDEKIEQLIGVYTAYRDIDRKQFEFYLAEDSQHVGGRRKFTRHRKQKRKQGTRRIRRNRTLRGRRRH